MRPRLTLSALVAGIAVALPAVLAGPALAKPATCSVSGTHGTDEGGCQFEARGGGSFSVQWDRGPTGPDLTNFRLQIEDGKAQVSGLVARNDEVVGLPVTRDTADPACWVGEGLRLCARALGEGEPAGRPPADAMPAAEAPPSADESSQGTVPTTTPRGIAVGEPTPGGAAVPADPDRFVFRCHMDACTWAELSNPRMVGMGSDAVPGRLVEATQRLATRDYPGGDYPDTVPDDAPWQAATTVRYFCSPKRPALRNEDGSWTVLPLPEVFGATEGATAAWIHLCEPDKVQDDVYKAVEALGFAPNPNATLGESYPDFKALTTK